MRGLARALGALCVLVIAACDQQPAKESQPADATSSSSAVDANAPLGQLSADVTPEHYRLELSISPSVPRYRGSVAIDLKLAKPAKVIYLHGQELNVSFVEAKFADGSGVTGTYAEVHKSGVARLTFARELPVGTATVTLRFDAAFNAKPDGLTVQEDSGEKYAWTQFEAISARSAFPCFDEPRFKVPFDITLTGRASDAIISNTPATNEETLDGGLKRVTFATTSPLPTYLIAFAVGPYDVVEGPAIPASSLRAAPIPLRGITVKGKGQRIRYALDHTPAMVRELEDYFGVAFPYPKLDIITPPNFTAGGMENAGTITYTERAMLLDDSASTQQKRYFNTIHAHELAHQWFGDLVTPKWWNDIWLNESFATWMAGKATSMLLPRDEFGREVIRDALEVIDKDALSTARAIRQPIVSTDDIYNTFDGLTYDKGGGVLSMFETYVGPDVFREGVRLHMRRFAHSVADVDDFMASIAEASKQPEVVTAFRSFLDQPGLPLVSARATCVGNKTTLEMSQKPYGASDANDKRVWQAPVCLRELGGKATTCRILGDAPAKLGLINRCGTAWLPNAGGTGYYLFSLDAAGWKALLAKPAALSPAEQVSTLRSLRAAFRAGDVDAPTYLNALEQFTKTGAWDVVETATKLLTEIRGDLLDHANAPAFEARMRKLLSARFAQVGWTARRNEPAATPLMRAKLADALVRIARDPAALSSLATKGAALARGDSKAVTSELASTALWASVYSGGAQGARDMISSIRGSGEAQFRTDAIAALTAARDPEAIDAVNAFVLGGEMRVRELRNYLRALFDDAERRDGAWAWMRANFDKLRAPVPPAAQAGFIDFAGRLCSETERSEIEAFFKPMIDDLEGAPRRYNNAVELVDRCVAWRKASAAAMLQAVNAR